MREILFRGKRKDNGEWIVGGVVHDDDKVFIVWTHRLLSKNGAPHFSTMVEVIPETLGQYTGGEDKTGNKIFEGDIVTATEDGDIEIGVIKYETPDCAFIIDTGGCDFVMDYAKDSEIIGNIHDNPKLLEEIK